MSGLWSKNQDLVCTTLLMHIVEHLRQHPTFHPHSLTLVLDNPENQNKNNVVMATLGFLCFSSPSKYFCCNNVMFMPEVPEVFTISWAKWSFLKQFKVETTYLNRCYMLASFFEASIINYSSLGELHGFHIYEALISVTLAFHEVHRCIAVLPFFKAETSQLRKSHHVVVPTRFLVYKMRQR
eukprot:m51a1_g11271 hypothetical protein (182) ;mRNA; r:17408-21134